MDATEKAKLNKQLQKFGYPVYLINEYDTNISSSQNSLKREKLKAILRRKYIYIIFHRIAQEVIYLYVKTRNLLFTIKFF